MCIYCGTIQYRKIYEHHHGKIPVDEYERTYEIHHIDGDRNNNTPPNLIALSMEEHYEIHYWQGDWGACLKMADKMKLSKQDMSELSRRTQKERLENGTHHFLDKNWQKEKGRKSIEDGTNVFVRDNPSPKRVLDGTHNFLGGDIQKKSNANRLKNGTHNLMGSSANKKMLENGTHPSQQEWHCVHCDKRGKGGNAIYNRYHGDNCKNKSPEGLLVSG